MSSYKKINISICENGFVVKDPESKKTFIFPTSKKLKKWLEDNIAQTGQVNDFCDGLDNGTNKKKTKMPKVNVASTPNVTSWAYLDSNDFINTLTNQAVQNITVTIDNEIIKNV